MHSVNVEIEVDLQYGVTVRGYERHRGAHVFEIDFELPERCACPKCRREAEVNVRWKNEVLPVRDLDHFGQPTFGSISRRCTNARIAGKRLVGRYFSSPLTIADKISLCNDSGLCRVLEAGNEFRQITRNDLAEQTQVSFGYADVALFVRTDSHLYPISTPEEAS